VKENQGKRSIKRLAQSAARSDAKDRQAYQRKSADSIQNFAAAIGIGTGNIASAASYGFNPITRVRTLLEWIHRGSWIGGVAVDLVADDMTRAGVEIKGDLDPQQIEAIQEEAVALQIQNRVNDAIKWSRLYGGSLGVLVVDGQNTATPYRGETIGKGKFRGLLVLDRWQVEPSLEDLVTEAGPHLGLPKYYRVTNDAPGLVGQKIHHSRCLRLEGIRLPYWQRVMENLWGISIIERLYDRMLAFDSATQGAAQLVYKSYIRTYKIEGLREIISSGGPMKQALVEYVNFMRQTQSIEGMTLLDSKDEFEGHVHAAFSGLSDALLQFGQQLAGALQIPLTRLFGQSPAGLNATGESDLRTYYDGINQQQEKDLRSPMTEIYKAIARSLGITVPDGFRIGFRPLWQLSEQEKATIAESITKTVIAMQETGIISDQLVLKELKQSSVVTGVWTNITREEIDAANDVPTPPIPEETGNGNDPNAEEETPNGPKTKTGDSGMISKEAAGYEDPAKGKDHCGECKHFLKDSKTCQMVEGSISAGAWCKLFAPA